MSQNIDMKVIERTRKEVFRRYPSIPLLGLDIQKPSASARDRLVMANIHTKPFLTIDLRASLLEMSSPMVRRAMAELEAKGWIQQIPFSRRPRGYNKYPNITSMGIEAMNLEMPEEGTGSFLHRKSQAFLRDLFQKQGLDSRIEFLLNGKRVDVGFMENDKHVAVEVALSSAENERANIVKDTAAGFKEIRLVFRESSMIERVKQLLAAQKFKLSKALKLELLTDYLILSVPDTETSTV